MKHQILLIAAMIALLAGSPVPADELVGVAVYPGATLDEATTGHLEEDQGVEGAAYRTNDAPEQVLAFYHKKGYELTGPRKKNRIHLRKGDVEVTIQGPPRKDRVTRETMKDTLVIIVQKD